MWWQVVLIAVLAGCLYDPVTRLPHPFQNTPVVEIDDIRYGRIAATMAASVDDPVRAVIVAKNNTAHHKLLDPSRLTRLFQGQVVGAESVAVNPDGRLTMLDKFAFVHHAAASADGKMALMQDSKPLYIGPGRPLGYHYLNSDILIVCDSLKGLIEV